MSHSFSLYLDIIRIAASIAVFLDHICSYPFTRNVIWHPLGTYGETAIIIFFVLSGYVIAYVVSTRENTASLYVSARVSRIYSVVIIALIATSIFDNLGLQFNPEFYSHQKIMWKPQSIMGYVSSFFFINEYQIFKFNGISPGTNAPFWSLSFEVAYYVAAGLILFLKKWAAIPAIVLLLALAGKTIVALLPLWILGYCLYYFRLPRINMILLYALFVLSLCFLVSAPKIASVLPTSESFDMLFPWGRGPFNRNLVKDYMTAAFFCINLVCARAILASENYKIPHFFTSSVRWMASLTFPLYLLHFPALSFFGAISPWGNESIANAVMLTVSTFALVIVLTPICEKLKSLIRNACLTGFGRFSGV
jgi:peptidoglycan/LPS O-acetylase OafA/YrhL